MFHGREKIYVSPGAVPDACLVLDSPYWLVQVGEELAAVSGTAAKPWNGGSRYGGCSYAVTERGWHG